MQGGMAGAIAWSTEGGTSKEPAGLTSVSPWVSRQSEHRPLRKRCNPKESWQGRGSIFSEIGASRRLGVPFPHAAFAWRFRPRPARVVPSRPPPLPRRRSAVCVCVRGVTLYGAQRQRKLRSHTPSHRTTDSEYAAWIDVPPTDIPGTSIALGAVGLTGNAYGPSHHAAPAGRVTASRRCSNGSVLGSGSGGGRPARSCRM